MAKQEDIITDTIIEKMTEELHYKEIYKSAKAKIIIYAELIGRSAVPQFQLEHKQQLQLF